MYELYGGKNPNDYCAYCGKLALTSVYFRGRYWCGNEQCIKKILLYWAHKKIQYEIYNARPAWTPPRTTTIKNEYRGLKDFTQDATERIYTKTYRAMPKFRDFLIDKHRKRKQKIELEQYTLNKYQQQKLGEELNEQIKQEERDAQKLYDLERAEANQSQ